MEKRKGRFVLCNDGGSLAGPGVEAPIGAEQLEELVIGRLRGTQINTLYWQLGTDPYLGTPTCRFSDVYSHRTEVAPMWGDERTSFSSAGTWRIYENARHLYEQGTDPAEVVVDWGKAAGLEVFLSMRVKRHARRTAPGGRSRGTFAHQAGAPRLAARTRRHAL